MDPTNSLFNPAALSVPNFANQLGLGQSTIWVMIRKGDLASGTYVYRIAGAARATGRLVLE